MKINKSINIQKKRLLTNSAQALRPRATPKIRIINISINSPTYSMAHYLNDILTKALTENKYNARNSFELKNIMNQTTLQLDDMMVSFNKISMYEKIPTKLVNKSLQ